MTLTLKVWRQRNAHATGRFVEYQANDVIPDMSFLEMLDVVNEDLTDRGEDEVDMGRESRHLRLMCRKALNLRQAGRDGQHGEILELWPYGLVEF